MFFSIRTPTKRSMLYQFSLYWYWYWYWYWLILIDIDWYWCWYWYWYWYWLILILIDIDIEIDIDIDIDKVWSKANLKFDSFCWLVARNVNKYSLLTVPFLIYFAQLFARFSLLNFTLHFRWWQILQSTKMCKILK